MKKKKVLLPASVSNYAAHTVLLGLRAETSKAQVLNYANIILNLSLPTQNRLTSNKFYTIVTKGLCYTSIPQYSRDPNTIQSGIRMVDFRKTGPLKNQTHW
jgi:hypothetical protein